MVLFAVIGRSLPLARVVVVMTGVPAVSWCKWGWVCCIGRHIKRGIVWCVLGTRVFCVCVRRPGVDDSCFVMRLSLLCHLQRLLHVSC